MGNTEIKQEQSTLNARFFIFLIVAIGLDVFMFMVNPTIALVATDAGASASVVGVINSINGLASFLLMIIVGPMTMIMPPNIMAGVFIWVRGLSYFMYSFYSIPLYVVAKILDGFSVAFLIPSMLMLAGDCMNMKDAGKALGVYQARNSIAKVVGPVLGVNGAVLLWGYVVNFRIAAAAYFVMGVLAFGLKLKNTEFVRQPFKLQPKNIIAPGAFLPLIITIFFCMPSMALGTFNMVYVKNELGYANVGIMMAAGNLISIVAGPVFSGLSDKIGVVKGLLIGMVMFILGPVLFLVGGSSFILLIAAFTCQFTGFACMAGVMQALLIKQAPPSMRGVAGNVWSGGMNLGSFFGPILLGVVIDYFGYRAMYVAAIIPVVIAAILVFIYSSSVKKQNAAANA